MTDTLPQLKAAEPAATPHVDRAVALWSILGFWAFYFVLNTARMAISGAGGQLGMLPRRYRNRRDVDGLPVNRKGHPTPVNLDANGKPVRASRAPSECQLSGRPGQNWNASHTSWDNGRNDGFANF